ncbi:MAG: hypothetical protein KatS3mg060_2408 [Dehalococcoidia bacterium]|nr:MAG: hypothetical protein KatS3mg060_2408 [Dehalococcoidia bacterium]
MIRLETTTRAIPPTVLQLAREFFSGEYGLTEASADERSVVFEGGGGSVAISARGAATGTIVEITSREWDLQARQFVERLRKAT